MGRDWSPRYPTPHQGGSTWDIGDKIEHAAEEAKGKVKEGFGKVTDNERVEAEGQADQAAANVKQAGDDVADAAKKAF